ncbi:S8 family peptidase [Halopiger djelfimassiliensis]|uniref:S8 family peptidase n=1 Tax=Halopiger djelfimassiliensis TaxID=1293047 RepID=UPI001E44DCFC|nr:S8 family serine peptidase [Halopiger djelfimassiliensis]
MVDTASVDGGDIEVLHRLEPVDLAVVRGRERDVEALHASFARDVECRLEMPTEQRSLATDPGTNGSDTAESLYEYQWDKQDQGIRDVHESYTRGEGTRVAVIDGGVAATHPALEHAVDEDLSKNFTEDEYGVPGPYAGGHGTHVAGIVAASDDGNGRVVGTAPDAEIVDCRVFSPIHDPDQFVFLGDVLAAIVHCVEHDVDVANLSLGAYLRRREEGVGRFWGRSIQRTTTYATREGVVLTHACGNWGGDLTKNKDYVDTSMSAGGLTVSATGPVGYMWGNDGLEEPVYRPASYTNYGVSAVDLAAPGGDSVADDHQSDMVLNCLAEPEFDDDGTYLGASYEYGYLAGTSMASPQAAGAAALIRSVAPGSNANQVKNTLQRTATVPTEYGKQYYGSGYLDTLAAVESVR